jgi:hypothetical protein
MLRETEQFRFDESRVISEVIDGEFVLVHFESGCYFSIRGSGAEICRLLLAGHNLEAAAGQLAKHHHLPQSQIGADVDQFVAQLLAEKLLVATGGQTRQPAAVELSAEPYAAPSFEKFDDMADQLLLDPIHEIGQAGWPVRPAA